MSGCLLVTTFVDREFFFLINSLVSLSKGNLCLLSFSLVFVCMNLSSNLLMVDKKEFQFVLMSFFSDNSFSKSIFSSSSLNSLDLALLYSFVTLPLFLTIV